MTLLVLLSLGCAAEDPAELAACDDDGETRVAVIHDLRFARLDENNQTPGFNLDGLDSDAGDEDGCNVQDYTDPEGNTGIDNSFATLIPILELTEAQAVEALIADAIASGELLFLLEAAELDDPRDDGCVDFGFYRGVGSPDMSSTGEFLPGQTFDIDSSRDGVVLEDLQLEDGRLTGQPFETRIPVTIFDVSLDFAVHDGAMRVTLDDDGRMHGYFGGGVEVQTIIDLVTEENVDAALAETVISLMGMTADLAPDEDGVCQQISINFEFEAVSAFFFSE